MAVLVTTITISLTVLATSLAVCGETRRNCFEKVRGAATNSDGLAYLLRYSLEVAKGVLEARVDVLRLLGGRHDCSRHVRCQGRV